MKQPANADRVKSDPLSASRYRQRKPRKHQGEMQMMASAFADLPSDLRTALDAPCGVGRLSLWLAQQGLAVTAVDLGDAALDCCRELAREHALDFHIARQDVFALEYREREFDLAVCFRLLHHFQDPATQAQLVRELCRVTDRYVLISYFSTYSVTTLRRRLGALWTGTTIRQNPTRPGFLKSLFAENGFAFRGKVKRSGLLHSLQLASFERVAPARLSSHHP